MAYHGTFDGYFRQVEDDASASPRLSLKGARIVRSHVEYEIELSFLGQTFNVQRRWSEIRDFRFALRRGGDCGLRTF